MVATIFSPVFPVQGVIVGRLSSEISVANPPFHMFTSTGGGTTESVSVVFSGGIAPYTSVWSLTPYDQSSLTNHSFSNAGATSTTITLSNLSENGSAYAVSNTVTDALGTEFTSVVDLAVYYSSGNSGEFSIEKGSPP